MRRGLVVSIVLFPPTSLKDRVIKALELCSCGKEKKNYWTLTLKDLDFQSIIQDFRLALCNKSKILAKFFDLIIQDFQNEMKTW